MLVSFGDFVLDRGTRQLWRGKEERRLGPKAFELLELLLKQRPNVVPRERIRDRQTVPDRGWPRGRRL